MFMPPPAFRDVIQRRLGRVVGLAVRRVTWLAWRQGLGTRQWLRGHRIELVHREVQRVVIVHRGAVYRATSNEGTGFGTDLPTHR